MKEMTTNTSLPTSLKINQLSKRLLSTVSAEDQGITKIVTMKTASRTRSRNMRKNLTITLRWLRTLSKKRTMKLKDRGPRLKT